MSASNILDRTTGRSRWPRFGNQSPASWLASQPEATQQTFLKSLTSEEVRELPYAWDFWARANQLIPPGDWWDGWLVLAGRGFGKTRTAVEAVQETVELSQAGRIGIVSETSADGRDIIAEGESGFCSVLNPNRRPIYEASKRRLTWSNGAIATLYDAREPDQLRGPQHDFMVFDELAKYRYAQDVFDNAMFGLRLGTHPRWIATTTPRPTALIKALLKDRLVTLTRGSSTENLHNLAETFKRNVIDRYAGTRLGRQELNAEILEDLPGALWTRAMLDKAALRGPVKPGDAFHQSLRRVTVAVDPSGADGKKEKANDIGITVQGMRTHPSKRDRLMATVLADLTCNEHPSKWAAIVCAAAKTWGADAIVAEQNFGGAMVEAVIRSADPSARIIMVTASRAKHVRAEPVAARYEQEEVEHAGHFAELEDELCNFTTAGYVGETSPNRADALIWGLTDLFGGAVIPAGAVVEVAEQSQGRSAIASARLS